MNNYKHLYRYLFIFTFLYKDIIDDESYPVWTVELWLGDLRIEYEGIQEYREPSSALREHFGTLRMSCAMRCLWKFDNLLWSLEIFTAFFGFPFTTILCSFKFLLSSCLCSPWFLFVLLCPSVCLSLSVCLCLCPFFVLHFPNPWPARHVVPWTFRRMSCARRLEDTLRLTNQQA